VFSLIIPAYNEAQRLPPYLGAVRPYLEQEFAGSYEVIVVDDGREDGRADLLQEMATSWRELNLVRHAENQGKGAAVRTGMLAAKGDFLLFADADGAAPIEEERRLRETIEAGADLAVGSRLVDGASVTRSPSRALLGRAFAGLARCLLQLPVRDTQCWFKMFRGESGRRLFGLVEENGYLFDLEVLVLAGRLGLAISEVPIKWSDVPGSKLHMSREAVRIVRGVWRLRRRSTIMKRDPENR